MTTDERGKEFQDFVSTVLNLPFFASRKYQLKHGESPSALGFEIKLNSKVEKYGVWIEVAEKRNPNQKNYVIADWVTNNNMYFMLAGNESLFYVFHKKRLFYEIKHNELKEINGKTSIGFNMSPDRCDTTCQLKWASRMVEILDNESSTMVNIIKGKAPYQYFLTCEDIQKFSVSA